MPPQDTQTEATLSLDDLAQIVCEGNVEGDLQERVAAVIRTDPRFTRQFEELEAMAAEIGADDLWEGLERNQEFDRLLAAESWEDPAEILNPDGGDLYEVSYRKLLAVAVARLSRTAAGRGEARQGRRLPRRRGCQALVAGDRREGDRRGAPRLPREGAGRWRVVKRRRGTGPSPTPGSG